LRRAITESGLPLLFIALYAKLTAILTEITFMTSVSRAMNLEFDWDTLSKTLHMTSPDSWSFRLKLIPTGLSLWFTWFRIVMPTMSPSPASCNTCPNRSFTLPIKCVTGSLLSEGVIKRALICLPTAFYRLYSLVFLSSMSNLRAMFSLSLYKKIHTYLGYTQSKWNSLT